MRITEALMDETPLLDPHDRHAIEVVPQKKFI
jgi:hypothetical protein